MPLFCFLVVVINKKRETLLFTLVISFRFENKMGYNLLQYRLSNTIATIFDINIQVSHIHNSERKKYGKKKTKMIYID